MTSSEFFKKSYPAYHQIDNKTRIFFNTNFNRDNYCSNKPLLVFNYGLVCSNFHWKFQLPFFDSLGYQILIHDYRFHFNSTSKEDLDNCDFGNLCSDLKEILDSFGATNIVMIGHSMGVNVTLEYAYRYPEMLTNTILISGTVLPPQDIMFDSNIVDLASPLVQGLATTYPTFFKSAWNSSYKNPLARRAVLRGGFNIEKTNDDFVQTYMKRIGELSSDLFFTLMEKMREHDIINHLEKIKTKTLIIGGDKDKVIPNYLQKILYQYLENSDLYIVRDGSHVPQVDFPNSINERILRFIS